MKGSTMNPSLSHLCFSRAKAKKGRKGKIIIVVKINPEANDQRNSKPNRTGRRASNPPPSSQETKKEFEHFLRRERINFEDEESRGDLSEGGAEVGVKLGEGRRECSSLRREGR